MTLLSTALNMSSLSKGDTFTDPDTGIQYVMQSIRATRKGCKFCGQGFTTADRESGKGVWWASPVDGTGDRWVLVNQDGSSHHNSCTKKPAKSSSFNPVKQPLDEKLGALEALADKLSAKPEPLAPWEEELLASAEPEAPPLVSHAVAIADPEVIEHIRNGLKIKAIKRYRELTASSLLESKNAIDALAHAMANPLPTPAPAPLPDMSADDSAKVKAVLDLLMKPSITPEQVKTMVDYAVEASNKALIDHIAGIISDAKASLQAPTVVQFKQADPDAEPVTIVGAHAELADIVLALRAKRNVFMVGMAGTGKTTLAKHAADAMGLDFYDISLSPDAGRHLLMGFVDANGNYIPPALHTAWVKGGVFHFDECDNSNPGLITVVNQILSHGYIRFADGKLVEKHADFYAMASGNTYGNGPDQHYVGRQPLDAAFKNRWIMATISVDEKVEEAMCFNTGASANTVTKVLRYIRALRQSATEQQIAMLFTPRNSENLCVLLHIGWSLDKAVNAAVRMGASDTDWRKVHRTDQGAAKIPFLSL